MWPVRKFRSGNRIITVRGKTGTIIENLTFTSLVQVKFDNGTEYMLGEDNLSLYYDQPSQK
jgi:hypothetical protein